MTVSLAQAIALGLLCGVAKTCVFYAPGVFMFNTVLFNAVLVGAVLGNIPQAMIIGASVQMVYLGVIAAGGNQPTDPCMSSYVAIPIALVSGLDTTAAVALAVPVGLLGAQIINLLYLMNGFFAQKGDAYIDKGDVAGMTRWSVILCTLIRVICFAIPVGVAVYFGSSALQGVLDNIPQFVTNGLTAMGACLPAVGFAIIANLISKPKYIPFFFAGFFMIQYTKIGTIPLLLTGAFITFLYITFTANDYKGNADDDDEDEDDEEMDEGEKLLSKKDVLKAWFVWWTSAELCHSFERMQAPSFCTALAPSLKKFYPGEENKEKYIEALKRNMTFFNTEAHWGGGPILGLTLAMEEKKSRNYNAIPGEVIMNLKTGLMGPLAGIGDTISWSTLMYLLIGLFLPLAKEGNPLGGIAPIVLFTIICFSIGYFLTTKCYTFGYSFAENMLKSGLVNMIIAAASILGLFMMGGLASTYVTVGTPLTFVTSTFSTSLQSILDSIAPGLLPLAVVLSVWGYLAKVKRNYFAATLGVTLISLVLGCVGIIR
ncbi:MAG: PTS system mannose/fructose/sorbose family transporter subunit IID [Clostridiales bacterium]|nr:PTS system mannose/fructose/sorbose family transporter subunit IID [Clostridiales bacterium]